jgi:hypothetical protein
MIAQEIADRTNAEIVVRFFDQVWTRGDLARPGWKRGCTGRFCARSALLNMVIARCLDRHHRSHPRGPSNMSAM